MNLNVERSTRRAPRHWPNRDPASGMEG